MNPILQKPVSRPESILTELSSLSWSQGVGNFFSEGVPFSYSTGKLFAQKLSALMDAFSKYRTQSNSKFQWLELGSGLGMLSRQVLDVTQSTYPNLYNNLSMNVTDNSEALVEQMSLLFEEHPHKASFNVVDANAPDFGQSHPNMVVMSYILDSMHTVHIETDFSQIHELAVQTEVDLTGTLIDTQVFPPRIVTAETVLKEWSHWDDEKKWVLSPMLVKMLKETYVKVPLSHSAIPKVDQEDIADFVKQKNLQKGRFNIPLGLRHVLAHLTDQCDPSAIVVIHDFGYPNLETLPKQDQLATHYGVVTCHAITFDYVSFLAEQMGWSTWITPYKPGETQVMLLQRGGQVPETLLKALFAEKGYDRIQDVVNSLFELKGTPQDNKQKTVELWNGLTAIEKEDFLILLSFASQFFEDGFYEEAIDMVHRIPSLYDPIALPSYLLLGKCYAKLNQAQKAFDAFEKALRVCMYFPSVHNEISLLALKLKQYGAYTHHAKQFIKFSGEGLIWEHLVTLSLVFAELGQKQEGKALLDWIISTGKTYPKLVKEDIVKKADTYCQAIFG